MKAFPRALIVFLHFLHVISVGCSTVQHRYANSAANEMHAEKTLKGTSPHGEPTDQHSENVGTPTAVNSAVMTVAHHISESPNTPGSPDSAQALKSTHAADATELPLAPKPLTPHLTQSPKSPRTANATAVTSMAQPIDLSNSIIPQTAPDPATPSLTLEQLEQLALTYNPAIQQATAASAQAGGIRTQVGLKPNPSVGYFGEEIGNDGTGGLHGGFVSQMFVRGNKLAWNRRVLDHDVATMNWLIEVQRRRVVTDIRVAFYDALVAQKKLQLARDFQAVASKGVAISEKRIEAKVGTVPDLLQSEIQLNEVFLLIQQAEFELAAALSELAAIAGVEEVSSVSVHGDLATALRTLDSAAEFARITAASPQLAAAQARVDRARANLQRQNVQPISNVTAQLGSGADDATGNAFANVQLQIPIPVHNANEGNIRAAHAEYCAAVKNVERIRLSIQRELARVMRQYQVAEATVNRYQDAILPKAEETLRLVEEAQAAGEFDFLRVLTARRAYFDANLQFVAAQGELAKANATIDGLLLTGSLSNAVSYDNDDGLRGQALNIQ